MTDEIADRINSAVSRAWLFEHGLSEMLSYEDIAIINSVSVAQIQTATDCINAADECQPSVDGKRSFRCTIDPLSAEALKQYVGTLPKSPSAHKDDVSKIPFAARLGLKLPH